jgi:hypothetical protein
VDRNFSLEFVEGVPYLASGLGDLGQTHFP